MESPAQRGEVRILIRGHADIVAARQAGRELASECGFSTTDQAVVATAISELARNIALYAGRGDIILSTLETGSNRGIEVVAVDEGPGILDVSLALRDGYSTSGGLGMGLPGVQRLMDEFQIRTEFGKGTTVTVRKWRQAPAGRSAGRAP